MTSSRLAFTLFFSTVLAGPATAHGLLEDRLALLDRSIAADPGNGDSYLRRAELRIEAGQLAGAWIDIAVYDTYLPPGADPAKSHPSRLLRAQLLESIGAPDRARSELDALLFESPEDLQGLRARADLRRRGGDTEGAARDYARALAASTDLDPDLVLHWARMLLAAGSEADAIAALDAAEQRFGPVPVLLSEGVTIARAQGNLAGALKRLDRLEQVSPPSALLLVTRARLLREAGWIEEARAVYAGALSALETVPAARRNTRAAQALVTELRAEMEALP